MNNSVDVCVIGSGFGGGPAALRAAEAGATVAVIEQGARWDGRDGSRQFRQVQGDVDYYSELFDIHAGMDPNRFEASIVVGGKGLGGGSLVYSMVSLRAPSIVFDDPVWPGSVNRTSLDPFYERAEAQLGVAQVEWTGNRPTDDWKLASRRDALFAEVCQQSGISCDPVPVAVNSDCENLGWCTTGCTKGGKNSVDIRYLQTAEDLGAEFMLSTRVDSIAPAPSTSGRRWQVAVTSDSADQPGIVYADDVFVAAGAVGSPALLQRSAAGLPGGISAHTGRNLSRGGDMMIPLVVPDDFGFDDMEMLPGKIIGSASFEYLFEPPPGISAEEWQPFIIEPMMILPVISSLIVADPGGAIAEGDMRTFGLGQKHLMQKWGTRLLHLGIMGIDGMDGSVKAGPAGGATVKWGLSDATRRLFRSGVAAVQHLADSVGGQRLPGWHELRGDALSIHPLGTCRMADTVEQGVVDERCRVFTAAGGVHDGLHVVDASTFSSPIAVNTSLTAAAVSEWAMSLWASE